MSSPYEDKPGAGDTTPPVATGATAAAATTPAPPALVSASGPMMPAGEATWGNGAGLNVRYAGRTAVGLVREHNEDNFVIANLTSGERGEREASLSDVVGEGGLLFAVCDGMGGAAAGEVASQMAVDVLHEAMRRGGSPRERDVLARRLVSAVEEAGRRIFDAAQKERSRRGMGTTATAAVLIDKVLFVAEVGDSRAYLLRGGQLKQLTKDQSLVNQLIEAGHLTEAEAEAFEHSNIILQALGTSETVQVDLTFVELRRGDRLMLCSDGLSGLVSADTLRDTLSAFDDPAECTAALIRHAEASGGHDNITVVVIDFDGEELELPRDTDSFGYLQYPLVPAAHAASTFADEEVTDATQPPAGFNGFDALPSYTPPAGPRVETNSWLWVSAGLVAMLVGAWLLAMGDTVGGAAGVREGSMPPEEEARSEPSDAPAGNAEGEQLAAAQAAQPQIKAGQLVSVRVHTDLDDAVLLINGESRGPLAKGREQPLELAPGQYRFEAQAHGETAVTVNLEVAQDAQGQDATPLDVNLSVPQGSAEPSKPTAPANGETPTTLTKPAAAKPAATSPAAPVSARTGKPDEHTERVPEASAPKPVQAQPAAPSQPQVAPPAAADGSVAKAPPPAAPPRAPAPAAQPQKPAEPASVAPTLPAPSSAAPRTSAVAPTVPVQAPKATAPAQQGQGPAPTKPPAGAAPADRKPDSPIPDNPF